ncbi:MAG: Multidrug resistance protein MexB [Spirochaetes bacterium ADurb.Bin218]|jgi:multidrug efflux pump subunit AcrB|nr:efflux RND transporter permease subunit [Spirochaetota bacterium]OQA98476.1 MAG: Multidrug resistance protein MexB [Spirochaetes bacterium ADurb.Bin218]HOQ12162.1 efflux RND transporter permease subunit [Spirochaetota bacterium]HOV10099.1 efflux RND transporter permease subunit [Spirochaetota bacterium]HPX90323.1 efflux RND transporter permease subunit [Spirochaetota bacterium]
MNNEIKKGFAGNLAERFIKSRLTVIIAAASILLGIFAVILTPKEEEPQISVPMIDVEIFAPGYESQEVERKVTEPVERAVWGLDGVEYVYSVSRPHGSLVTVRFKVGEPLEPSLVKVHNKLMEIKGMLPEGVSQPRVKSYTIDDVPFLILTFSSQSRDDYSLRSLVAPLARELSSTPDLSNIEMLGGRKRSLRVIVNPDKLSANGVSLIEIARALKVNDASSPAGKNWDNKTVMDVEVGGRLKGVEDVENISIGLRAGRVVKIKDVASVQEGPEERTKVSYLLEKDKGSANAVSIVFAKRKGTNVVVLSRELVERARIFSANLPQDIKLSVMRDYGYTAGEKSNELIEHLLIATLSVAALIAIFMGLRASLVVSIAIPVTLALTLAIYYFMGYTLNRVTLFALIFSIGILVDDAIVVVENIERHLHSDKKLSLVKATINAVSEVGNPTILATFTVIAAILPMAFVRGLMGPYMKPIPVGASLAMLLSLLVAFIVTPWASAKLLKKERHGDDHGHKKSKLDQIYIKVVSSLVSRKHSAFKFAGLTVFLLILAMTLFLFKAVKVKMLPFDNKNEFQITLDYPPTTTLEQSSEWSKELASILLKNENVLKVQIFAGEPAPFSFSGMVKHTFMRRSDYMNDLQVLLTNKDERKKSSHEIIEELRPVIVDFAKKKNAVSKILEIPPGPPVMATLVAEVYGPDKNVRQAVAREIYDVFSKESSVVDLDYSWRPMRPRQVYEFNQYLAGLYGVSSTQAVLTGGLVFSETPVVSLADVGWPEEINVNLSVMQSVRSSNNPFAGEMVPTFESGFAYINQVINKPVQKETVALYRKNLKPVEYVMSELSGKDEAPVYGILKLAPKINYPIQTAEVPWNTTKPVVKWDGEWFITYEVFRDLGISFAVVLVLIYILVVGWFRSYIVPVVIMAPIPISLIGILPGHAIVGSYFTATSMIGFIAGAGIIVRNSIILVDFIEQEIKRGVALRDAVINAGVIRFRPMLLTAAAVVVGSFVMLFDPIFQGLAVSLMFGEIAATLLSRFAVPALYYWIAGRKRVKQILSEVQATATAS